MTAHVRPLILAMPLAAVVACSDGTSPMNLTPDRFEMIAEQVALDIEGSVIQLTSGGAMGGVGTPSFSLQSQTGRAVLGDAAFALAPLQPPLYQIGTQECGVPSQVPPVDTDGDGVPDDLSITFALPACQFTMEDGTFAITGVFWIYDPTPAAEGMALAFGLDRLEVRISSPELDLTATRDGNAIVSATTAGLSQTQSWTETASAPGYPSIAAALDWTASFAAAAGQTLAPGQPLPDGSYAPNGSFSYREGKRVASLTVTTVTPLQYSAACASGETFALSPFTAGEFRVSVAGQQGSVHVRVTYSDCDWAVAEYVGG
ncbi:MAG TPA: hypothetical protein VMM18_12275 [Gemmatimonadaceae bacterium]|nr:hypothetical protein [Gemmatimonadaceae bacterium]